MPEASTLQDLILETAEENPDLSDAEIAGEVGCEEHQVREAFNEHGDPRKSGGGNGLLWLIIAAIVIGGVIMLSQGDSGGGDSAMVALGWLLA